ncbi:choice-of-anchor D domain-containing protein [Candidatus Eisenbacteria bacterium]|uniref:Choice-of-anchor D domain-containing protein n=1 Tax=Eiseniibacteriota bacterium TaxID=2212470 RepID=A0ABV6YNR9_UNCEI
MDRFRFTLLVLLAGLTGLMLIYSCGQDPASELELTPCDVTPGSLNFGNVKVGEHRELTFTITNAGTLSIDAKIEVADSGCFNVQRGGGDHEIGPDQVHVVAVRFAPSSVDTFENRITTGTDCGSVPCIGVGRLILPPECGVEPDSLSFSVADVGGSQSRTFAIANTGGGTLSGDVTESCDEFTVSPASYNLGGGQSETFTVTYRPVDFGDDACAIDLGTCGSVTCAATGPVAPGCDLDPAGLNFNVADVGGSESGTFTIANSGGGTLSGNVTESCGEFTVSPTSYSLGGGESETFTVTYAPVDFGNDACTIDLGTCGSFLCFATGPIAPGCAVDPTGLDFTVAVPGGSHSRTFTVTNTGGGTLSGSVTESCSEFTVSPASYDLGAGKSEIFTVTYAPGDCGNDICTISLGDCGSVACTATGPGTPECSVNPESLSFTVAEVGGSEAKTFTVTNTECGILSGNVTETCSEFTVSPASYSLGAGQSETFSVTYAPGDCGNDTCTVDLGACGIVSCTATGPGTPECGVDPESLSFNVPSVGGSQTRTFTVTNTECGTLNGDVTEACSEFTVSPASYSLGAGQFETFTVTYSPAGYGDDTCTVDLGPCGSVACTTTGPIAPDCAVDPTSLSFIVTEVGGSQSRTFSVTNTGGGTLSGSVTESCSEFTVSPGSYSLGAGESETFTVTYSPDNLGNDICTIELGICGSVALTATGPSAPDCAVDPANLSFDVAEVDSSQAETFTVTNTGGGTLSGNVTEPCGEFTVSPGSYSLGAGESEAFTVTYTPTGCGDDACTVDLGGCGSVPCIATGPSTPACSVSTDTLTFNVPGGGGNQYKTFTITHSGCGTLSGGVSETCDEFTVSPSTYSLTDGQSRTFTVTYAPDNCGNDICEVDLGACGIIICDATGPSNPVCVITPDTLTFGEVPVGGSSETSFTIENRGCGPAIGDIIESCGEFTVSPASYSIGRNQSETFTVTYAPTDCGADTCEIDLSVCGGISCIATGPATPECSVSTNSLSFSVGLLGDSQDRTFTVTNTKCGTLSGTVTEACGEFTVSPGSYSLSGGQSELFTVTYAPTDCGDDACTIDLGGCGSISCTTTGPSTPICDVSADTLSFDVAAVGGNQDRTFTITNTNCGTLSGNVTEACGEFTVSPGSYNLTSGQSELFTVTYAPTDCGDDTCTIDLGACGSAVCLATGPGTPECDVSADTLSFDVASVGGNQDRTFTITNTACGTLSGTVAESCSEFTVSPGSYSLTNGQSEIFTVNYAPTSCGDDTCTIDLGTCGTLPCLATGPGTPACDVDADTLGFSVASVGGSQDMTFTVTNTGCGALSGTVTESCGEFSVSPGSYSLSGGQSELFTVTYAPTDCGDDTCTVDLGTCGSVECLATGPNAPFCDVSPDTLSFNVAAVGGNQDRTFTITNSGCGTLSGTVTESCAEFTVSPGSYSLSDGQSEIFTVNYAPADCGDDTCTIDLGTCGGAVCIASGPDTPVCDVSPVSLDFGTLAIGDSLDKSFVIKNLGCGTLSGTVSSSCGDYTIVGTAVYSIAPADSATLTLRFKPSADGSIPCTIETGSGACLDVSLSGAGCAIDCSALPGTLDFGDVYVGCSKVDSFTITNTGTCLLTGSVSGGASSHYSILSGGGAYSLPAAEARMVTVEFAPSSAGTQTYTVTTGADSCSQVECTGVANLATCEVAPDTLDFGAITVGSDSTMSFTITNNGTSDLVLSISESCAEFSISSGGGSQTVPGSGGTHSVDVTFSPAGAGAKTCTVSLGEACLCIDVECLGSASVP